MHGFSFADIAGMLQATPLQQPGNPVVEYLLTDSRKLLFPEQTLFLAISGPQKNANDFIFPLYEKGVKCFIADQDFDTRILSRMPDANVIQVNHVLNALQAIACNHRANFTYPVIGITGSNGKTIVKEWLFQLLNERYNIIRSPRSYNSQVGVPLSVWQMTGSHNLGIFEAGISRPGEMPALQKIIAPTIGVIPFIGEAHAAGFESLQQKINEKLELFIQSRMLVYGADSELLDASVKGFIANRNNNLQTFTWSRKKDADLFISNVEKRRDGSVIHCFYNENEFSFFIPFIDIASLNNAITCCCVLLAMNENIPSVSAHMNGLKPVEMRLELKQGLNNCSIINDSYSADFNSLGIALDFLAQQQQHQKRTVILSDLLQSGLADDILYKRIAAILSRQNLYRFIGVGARLSANKEAFEKIHDSRFFESIDDFLKQLSSFHFQDETILLKAARIFQFEKISRALEQKMHETVLEINLNSLRNNLKHYRQQLKKDVKLMAMVKAFSYGSGSYEIANLLQHAGADYLGVAYADEAVELRKSGIRLPVMVMNTVFSGFDIIIQYQLEPELYSFGILESFQHYLQQHQLDNYPVHLKLDTGMHRLGFMETDIDALCDFLSKPSYLKIISVFSHLVASEDKEQDTFTEFQTESFLKMAGKIEQALGYSFIKHIANTSSIHRHPEAQLDMVRLGIGLYGIDKNQTLQNVTTLRTNISQVKNIKAGDSVGYGRKSIVKQDSKIATVRIGYADGYPRILGNGAGKMLVNEQLAPVIGNVCMDMTMLDITGVDANEGDEVIVFGEKPEVTDVADWAGTIPYEILTNISQRVKRVYFEE